MRRKYKALLIGIRDYNPPGLGGPDLSGPVNDVNDMKDALLTCGFHSEGIQILTNGRATKNNIMSCVSWLISDNSEGDSIVLYFAGHGSYKPTLIGNVNVREQVIRPYESSQAITVHELEQRFANRQPNVHLEVFMDCCHSGPPNQAINSEALNERGLVVRFAPPPDDSSFQAHNMLNFPSVQRYFFRPEVIVSSKASYVFWAACKIDQQATEKPFGSHIEGVFTYHLCSLLRSTEGNIPRGELDSLLTKAMNKSVTNQTPQLRAKDSAVSQHIFI